MDALIERLQQNGFEYVPYNQNEITHSYLKTMPIAELAEKLGMGSGLSDQYEKGVVEYLPEVDQVQWCIDSPAGLYETFEADSEDGRRLIDLFAPALGPR